MKKCILAISVSLMVCVSFAQAPKAKANFEDTIQYSLGVYMMQQLFAKTGFVVNNPTMFKKAIDDVILKKKLMIDPATTEARLLAYQNLFLQEKGKKLESILFEKIKNQPGFVALPNGVNYSMVKAGQGPSPSAKDTVILNLITTLPDGTEIDNTNKTKQSYMALAGDMIPGLKEVLYRMKEGALVRAIVPAAQAYGSQGTATIPPNSAVIYDIALVSVKLAK